MKLKKVICKETGKVLFIGTHSECAEFIAIHMLNEYYFK